MAEGKIILASYIHYTRLKINKHISLIFILSISIYSYAWDWWPLTIDSSVENTLDTLHYGVSITGVTSTGKTSPFWIQNNRNGDIAASPHSGNLTAGIYKRATQPHRWYDYDFALSLTGRMQSKTTHIFPKMNTIGTGYTNLAYAHLRLYVIDITAGIVPKQYGSPDEELTSGGLLFSNNTHPMPGIHIGIDNWTAFPGLYGYMEIRGGISNIWMVDNVYVKQAMIHHKWIGGRIGGKLPINLSYEFHHVAQWGGISPIYGNLGNDLHSFINAFLVKSGGTMKNDQLNAYGNHIGSQVLTLDIKGEKWKISAYWQNIFEDGPIDFIGFGMNAPDGLWGINITQQHWPFINSLTYEFIQTTDQSGPFHDRDGFVMGGNDNYYNNAIYKNGWNYWYRTIGNPFITSPIYNFDGTIHVTNNRTQAHYIGMKGDIYGYKYRFIYSHAKNYGTYNQPLNSYNNAFILEVSKHIEKAWGLDFSLSLAGDFGNQFGNQFGAMFSIRKQGIITKW